MKLLGFGLFFYLRFWGSELVAFLSLHFHDLFVIVRLVLWLHFGQSFHSFILILHSLEIGPFLTLLLFCLFSVSHCQLLFGPGPVLDCFTDEGVGGCAFDVFDIQTAEVLFVSCGGVGWVVADDGFFGNGGKVANSLEMFFIGGLEKLVALW